MKNLKISLGLILILALILSTQVFGDHLYVADIESWLVKKPKSIEMMSYQGAVNANAGSPIMYCIVYKPTDQDWLDDLEDYHGYTSSTYSNPYDAYTDPNLNQYCDEFVVYDRTDCNLAVNAAVTQAGILGCMVVEKDDVDTFVNSYGFSQHTDSDANLCGYWNNNEDCQSWQYNNQLNDCNSTIYCTSEGTFEGRNKAVDFCVSDSLFTFCLDTHGVHISDAETTQRDILDSYEPNSIGTGWWSKEGYDIERISEYGHTYAGQGVNLSVFSHLDPNIGDQARCTSLRSFDPNKAYVMFSFTQGDAMDNCRDENLSQINAVSITDPNYLVSERYPFGMMHSTIQAQWQPNIPEALYEMVDDNQMWSGKGYGYANCTALDDYGHFEGHLAKARQAMNTMDINDFMLNDTEAEGDPTYNIVTKIAQEVQPRSIIYKHQLDLDDSEDDEVTWIEGVPVFADPVFNADNDGNDVLVNQTVNAIQTSAEKRTFFWVFLDHAVDAQEIEPVMDDIADDPNIIIMPPDEWIELAIENEPNIIDKSPHYDVQLTDDTFVRETAPTESNPTDKRLKIRTKADGNDIYSYMKWVIDYDKGTITDVKMKLHCKNKDIPDTTVYEVSDSNWSQTTMTWNNKPSYGSSIDSKTTTTYVDEWAEFDLSSYITANGTYSLCLRTSVSTLGMDWSSKDSANDPCLVVTRDMPPTPDPMTWSSNPSADDSYSISMTATTATDDNDSVQYYFDEITGNPGGTDSGWQSSTSYTDTGLSEDTLYRYKVKARDTGTYSQETEYSINKSVTTPVDNTAPTPDPMTWSTQPYAVSDTEISMTASTATDDSGSVQYYFECTAGGGNDSGWQSSTNYNDTGLTASTQYTYKVKARDTSSNNNETSYSSTASATTMDEPDTTPPSAPTGLGATAGDGQVSLDWDDNTEQDFDSYSVYRSTTSGSGYSSIATDVATSDYTDSSASNGTTYYYVVTAVDNSNNESTYSSEASATPQDSTAPTPDPMTWSSKPASTGTSSIDMTATTASDDSGVQYYFECTTSGGHDSGWQSSTYYEDTGLSENTSYTYRAKARDQSANNNETTWSTSESATTDSSCGAAPMYRNGVVANVSAAQSAANAALPLLPSILTLGGWAIFRRKNK